MLERVRLAGMVIALIAAAVALSLKTGILCLGDTCGYEYMVFGRPVTSWGLSAYCISAMVFLFARRAVLIPWTGTVALTHTALYLIYPVSCVVCLIMLGTGYLMLVLALRASDKGLYPLSDQQKKTMAASVLVVGFTTVAAALPTVQTGFEQPNLNQNKLQVLTIEGIPASIELRNTPVLVFSPDCKHCDSVLQAVSKLDNRPVLATVHLDGAVEKMAAAGLEKEEYFRLAEKPPGGIPALISWQENERNITVGASPVLLQLGQ